MIIRQESAQDYDEVYETVKAAFASAEHSDGKEHDLVAALRKSGEFIPELSLVAEEEGRIVGHILFTKIKIGNYTELALAPLAVLPEFQRCGVGKALIEAGHEIARELGYRYSVVLGSERYYPKMGYVPAERYGIEAPFEVPTENFMAMQLCKSSEKIAGVVTYSETFGI